MAGMDAYGKIAAACGKVGNEPHVRALRDGLAALTPVLSGAGTVALVGRALAPWVAELLGGYADAGVAGDALATVEAWGVAVCLGVLLAGPVTLAAAVGHALARIKHVGSPLACSAVCAAAWGVLAAAPLARALSVLAPVFWQVAGDPVAAAAAIQGGALQGGSGTGALAALGCAGYVLAAVVALGVGSFYLALSGARALRFSLGDDVPPAVGESFSALSVLAIALAALGAVSGVLAALGTDALAAVSLVLEGPWRLIAASPVGLAIVYATGTALFALGIHQSTTNGVLVEPLATFIGAEALLLWVLGEPVPVADALNMASVNAYAVMGGTGCTATLVIAGRLFGRREDVRETLASATPAVAFNVNEPVIYGMPIVFNARLAVPFVLCSALGIALPWLAVVAGLVAPCVVPVPWVCPVVLSGFLTTGGDVRAALLQVAMIAVFTLIYLPFLKAEERSRV